MDNKQRLEFILKLERKAKRKKIIIAVAVVAWLGFALIYAQVHHFESFSK